MEQQIKSWMESLGWKPIEDMYGNVVGYRYKDRILMKPIDAMNWYAIKEVHPSGPPKF